MRHLDRFLRGVSPLSGIAVVTALLGAPAVQAQKPDSGSVGSPPLAKPGAATHAPTGGATVNPAPLSRSVQPGPALPSRSGSDPIVANIDGHPIYLSELGEASRTLPENLRSLPFDTLYPVLLDRMIDHEALVMMAREHGLENKPAVRRQIQAATERILEGAWLAVDAEPKVTEQAIRDRYNRLFANRPATEEVHARHILVTTKAEAETLLKELQNGADFATLARKVSKDPDAAKGGDLGFFRREQVWPSFADMAFSLQPGQIGPEPIHNEFGWHIVKVEERRLVAPPSYADVHDQIRMELMAEAVRQSVAKARAQVVIHKFNLDGSEMQEGPHLGSAPPQ